MRNARGRVQRILGSGNFACISILIQLEFHKSSVYITTVINNLYLRCFALSMRESQERSRDAFRLFLFLDYIAA